MPDNCRGLQLSGVYIVQSGQQTDRKSQEQLFISVADGICHALLQLNQLSETVDPDAIDSQATHWKTVQDITGASMALLEGYSMTLRLQQGMEVPVVVPMAAPTLLKDTVRVLAPYAAQFGVQIELDISPRLEPILTDRAVLQSALISLGQVFIMAHAETEEPKPVRLAAHKSRHGIVVGFYGYGIEMSAAALRRARSLRGKVYQPYSKFVSGPASGIFVADGLLHTVAAQLHAARYHNVAGLAVTMPACNQLQLV